MKPQTLDPKQSPSNRIGESKPRKARYRIVIDPQPPIPLSLPPTPPRVPMIVEPLKESKTACRRCWSTAPCICWACPLCRPQGRAALRRLKGGFRVLGFGSRLQDLGRRPRVFAEIGFRVRGLGFSVYGDPVLTFRILGVSCSTLPS